MSHATAPDAREVAGSARESGRARAAESAVIVLAVLSAIGAMYLAREVLVPLALAIVVATVLRPVVKRLEQWRLPSTAAAAIVVLALLAMLVGMGMAFEGPVRSMAADLPKSVSTARAKLESLSVRLRSLIGGGASQQPGRGGSGAAAPTTPASGTTPAGGSPATSPSSAPQSQAATLARST